MRRMRDIITRKRILWIPGVAAAIWCSIHVQSATAQIGDISIRQPSIDTEVSKERELRLLQLQEVELNLQTAETTLERERNEYEAMKRMWEDGIVSGKLYDDALRAYERAETDYETAKIALRRTQLNLLEDATHISILKAVKFRDETNRLWMEFTIRNSSNVEQAMVTPEDFERREDLESLLRIEDLIISITKDSVNIGDPLELKVPSLDYGKEFTGRFLLRDDVDDVTLVMEYLNTTRNERVYLEKQSGEDIVRVTCLQFAQEGTLGQEVSFGIRLERLAEDEKSFGLLAVGLPLKIKHQFEFQGKVLSQVKFSERTQRYDLAVKCFVPEDIPEEELEIPLKFYAVVADAPALKEVQNLVREAGDNPITREELASLRVGFEELQLIPKGFGEMQVRVANALLQATQGEDVEALIEVENTGTVVLLDVKVVPDMPPGWEVVMDPPIIRQIDLKEREAMRLFIDLPENLDVGQYEMRIQAQCDYKGERIESVEKNIKIDVEPRAKLLLNSLLALALLAAVIGVAVFTIRVARR